MRSAAMKEFWGVLLCAAFFAGGAFSQSTQLTTITHGARYGTNVTITLSRQEYVEQCFLQTPQGTNINLNTAATNGVTAFPMRTNFVSCRVVIGPMEQTLLGTWTLCGRTTVGGSTNERCQAANIEWAKSNPSDEWTSATEPNIEHPFQNGVSLSPVVRGGGGLQTCHVITPAGEDIALTADSDYPGLRRVLFDTDVRVCGVNIGPLNANFLGSWVLYGTFNSGSIGFNVATQPFSLSLRDGTEGNNDGTLQTINHGARLGTRITITLSRKDYTEEWSLRTPNGNTVQLANEQINGVQVFTTRTNFVSCRVVIGPMAQNLLGTWTLCGRHNTGGTTLERCQPANITWATNNPAEEWITRTEPNIDHPIHNGFSLSPIVRGGGGIRTCHVITPAGEDIALSAESDYPGLQRVLFNDDVSVCSVNFGPLDASFLGSWTLYGTYYSRSIGFNVATQPITLSIDGGVEGYLRTINHGARIGTKITITLSRKDYTEEFSLRTPNGNIVPLINAQINGVQVYTSRTSFVSCRVVIGPMTENLLGIWTLCGKHTVGGNTIERCQPANITWANNNPTAEWASSAEPNIVHPIHSGVSLSPVVRGSGGLQTCHVITPTGEDIALTADSDYPGLQRVLFNNDVRACGVNFGPLDDNFLGNWVLYGTFNSGSIGFNVATQPLTLSLGDGTEENSDGNLPTINHGARLGTRISITLSRRDYIEECSLRTPNGNTVQLANAQINGVQVFTTRTNFVSCRVVIGPMAQNLLGIWTLCGRHTVGGNAIERCQPANITWVTNNPAEEWITRTEPNIDHPIHNGFSLSPNVRGGGGIRTCHVITPAGEDIALTAESDYPGLQRVLLNDDVSVCSVNFGPLDASFLGSWTLYGTYYSRSIGFNVATQPITLSIDGGVEGYLRTINHGARIGTTITITLSRKDYTEQFSLRTPNGNIVPLINAQINGVQVYTSRTSFVSCRVVIGPMTENLLGIWTLCGKHTVGGNTIERCQPANITWANNNPTAEWASSAEPNIVHPIHSGVSLSPVVRGSGGLQTCHVITPTGEDIALTADSDYPGLQRVLFNNDVRACGVNFGPLDDNFLGNWVLYGTFNSGSIGFNVATQPLTLSLGDGTEENSDGTLPTINHGARLGTRISITLSRRDYIEECSLRTPNGNTVQLANAQINGVQVFTTRTNFVSCRVVIGPMAQNLLGIWTLCGRHTVGGNAIERCQPANITWALNNPADEWISKTEPNINHQIQNGVSMPQIVRGGGGIRTCHVITPAGEDIALTAESDYPGLRRVLFNDDITACSVNFGPLDASFQGSWTLYGTYNSRTIGFNVATQPLTLTLNGGGEGTDGNNGGTLPTINHGARLGTRISITLSRRDYIEECSLRTPNGNTVQLANAQINGVQVFTTRTKFVSCRVVIGPMAQNLLGIWTLCGRHTVRGNAIERCQPANITWALNNPADEWISKTEPNINHQIQNGVLMPQIVRGGGGIRTCHVITPAGEDIALTAESDYPGLRRVLFNDDITACSVNFGPLDASFQGSWTLYGTYNSRTIGFNVATQPLTLTLNGGGGGTEGNNGGTLPTINHGARLGTRISITLSRKDYIEECSLRTPNGNTVQLANAQINGVQVFTTRTNFVSCRVVIGPMAQNLLGIWTLCGRHTEGGNTIERCQPANITWASNNPTAEWISRTEPNIDHAIHDGFSLSPTVRGGGGILSCHVVTPDGEDIALIAESDYPGLRRILSGTDVNACSVSIGPLDRKFQGSWSLYGTFNSGSMGFNIATQPLTLTLEGNEHQNGRPMMLPTINHEARLGITITITLSRKDYTEECSLRSPNGETTQLANAQINGVQVYPTRSNFVSCRVVIGPLAESLLGTWTLCGKHTAGGNTFERCQPAKITWATNNPASEWLSTTSSSINYAVKLGYSLNPVVRGGGGLRTCHVITPEGEDIVLLADSDYPGLRRVVVAEDVTACSVHFGPFDAHFLGRWVLYGTFNSGSIGFNVASQPIKFSLAGSSTVVIWSSVVAISLVILIVGLLFGPKRNREWTFQRSSTFRSTIRKNLIKDPQPMELRFGQSTSTSGV